VDETRIVTTEGLITCVDPGARTRMDNHQRGMEISAKIGALEGHEQVLITTIWKETKRTEELEEAGYRPPTWAVLRALQQISSVTRVEGGAAIRMARTYALSEGQARERERMRKNAPA